MKEPFVKRGRLEIIYEILSVSRKPAMKTNILYKCNLSYNQLQKYLNYLASQNLLTSFENQGKELYRTTDKGKEFLDQYEQLTSLLQEKENTHSVLRNSYSNGILHNHRVL